MNQGAVLFTQDGSNGSFGGSFTHTSANGDHFEMVTNNEAVDLLLEKAGNETANV